MTDKNCKVCGGEGWYTLVNLPDCEPGQEFDYTTQCSCNPGATLAVSTVVRVPVADDMIAEANERVRKKAEQYGGDDIHAMPWSHDHMTLGEFEQWVESRAEAGRKIDIETCERGWWHAYDLDPYGILMAKGELPGELQQVGGNSFVRSPESNGWVWECDLPPDKAKAMYDRTADEFDA
jgi:hypothetical protein